jgi:hypothetical protein
MLGYWKTPDDPAVVMRTRALLNDYDLCAATCRQAQTGPRVLAGWWLTFDSAYKHPSLDKMPDSVFPVEDLRIRVELKGQGVKARQLDDRRFELSAGDWIAVVHVSLASFMNQPVRWELAQGDQHVYLDAVLHHGDRRSIDFHDAPTSLAYAIELVPRSSMPSSEPVRSTPGPNDTTLWRWNGLDVSTPRNAVRYAW